MTILPMYALIVLGYENHVGPAEVTQSKYLGGFFFLFSSFFSFSLFCVSLGGVLLESWEFRWVGVFHNSDAIALYKSRLTISGC